MGGILVNLLEQVISAQDAELVGSNKSDKIYEKKLKDSSGKYDYVPHTIYFTYVGFDKTSEKLRVDHYFWPEGEPEVEPDDPKKWPQIDYTDDPTVGSKFKDLVKQLAENAIGKNNNPKPYAHNFKNIKWRRKSYLVFFFDNADWKLHKFDGKKQAVIFYDDKFDTSFTPNHSFYDALDFERVIIEDNGNYRNGQAVAFINHFKREDGSDIKNSSDVEQYQFGMYFDIELATNKDLLAFIIDPGGTNQGPPLEP